jgi:hypothetical protein
VTVTNLKIDFISEPELEFGRGRHIDIRFGILNHGPLDVDSDVAPKRIRLGIVGTPDDTERLADWLESCRSEIPGTHSNQPNLHPPFPGFASDRAFFSTLVLDDSLRRTIPAKAFDTLWASDDANQVVRGSVDLFMAEFEYLVEHSAVDVLICAVPQRLVDLTDPSLRPAHPPSEPRLNFHDMLKARAMGLKPVQLVTPSTSDPTRAKRSKVGKKSRSIQDDATRAWNLHSALYYKAQGRPWRVPRDIREVTTCYVGISFYFDLVREKVLTSMAQVFDERGDGVVVRGGTAILSKEDRTPHLTAFDARSLMSEALTRYRETHENFPARVVIHKTSTFTPDELEGFRAATEEERVSRMDAISVSDDATHRLFRYGSYPPLRGTWLSLDGKNHILYTRGSVDFYATYPGLYIPSPLQFRCEDVSVTPKQVARELLALSKLNWNHTQFDGSIPITVVAARKVGAVLKYLAEDDKIAPRYSFYM